MRTSEDELTHKTVARAVKGRRLTANTMGKVVRALNRRAESLRPTAVTTGRSAARSRATSSAVSAWSLSHSAWAGFGWHSTGSTHEPTTALSVVENAWMDPGSIAGGPLCARVRREEDQREGPREARGGGQSGAAR